MKRLLTAALLLTCFCSCQQKEPFDIQPFHAQNQLENDHKRTKSIYFLVQGYTGTQADYLAIENHVCSMNRDSLEKLYRQYWFTYFRKSQKTNNLNIQKNPKDFFRYSTMEDNIAMYSFIADSFVGIHKYFLQEYPKESIHIKEKELCN